jgi:hypothetical protein
MEKELPRRLACAVDVLPMSRILCYERGLTSARSGARGIGQDKSKPQGGNR